MAKTNLKIFTENIEPKTINQIYTLVKQPTFEDCKVRIMPDTHIGKGCVIGFTSSLGEKIIPNVIGVDIACGMLTVELGNVEIDYQKLDEIIRERIPSGLDNYNDSSIKFNRLQGLHCYHNLKVKNIEKSIGTLGGGNHFIEVDIDDENNKYLIIHTGSRSLGRRIAEHYQNLAIELMQGKGELDERQKELIVEYKKTGRSKEIQAAIKEMYRTFVPKKLNMPEELCYLEGKYREMYLHDMKICMEYASLNRQTIAKEILKSFVPYGFNNQFETVHNYIDLESRIIRKGAISAKKDELVLIPINMRDGCIIGKGKGNDDWNRSAPHGAGRIMSRRDAKELVSLEEYEDSMKGIFTTSVGVGTIDESPMAYRPIDEIVKNIQDTVEIVKIIKPVYNFKAS